MYYEAKSSHIFGIEEQFSRSLTPTESLLYGCGDDPEILD